ncbi:helix-turn-helix domain-containing protein [Streptomyces sp. BH105]|uniref:helix-turn-helix domain-containing protein n=1 Tax=Streptomyces sp. BH105 TaxID=3410408 RepID=UPI003CED6765
MGRAEKNIETDNEALYDLAQWLRDQRRCAGLTYRKLAERTGLHATTLQRAASGGSVPQLTPVLVYAQGCGAPVEEARELWLRARREHIRSNSPHNRQPAPSPLLVRDFADLSAALRELYERAGAPSLRVMEKRAGGFGALPRSSAHRIVNKQSVPHCREQFRAYLRACSVRDEAWPAWESAWSRAWRFEKEEDAGLGLQEQMDHRSVEHVLAAGYPHLTRENMATPSGRSLFDRLAHAVGEGRTTLVREYRPMTPRVRPARDHLRGERRSLKHNRQLQMDPLFTLPIEDGEPAADPLEGSLF